MRYNLATLDVTDYKTVSEQRQSQTTEVLTWKYHEGNKRQMFTLHFLNVQCLVRADICGAWQQTGLVQSNSHALNPQDPRLRESPLSLLLHRWENWREERYGSLPRVSKSRALNLRAQAYNQLDYKGCYILRKVHLVILAERQHAVCYCTQMFSEPNPYFLYKIIRFILYVNKTYHKAPR